MNIKAAVSFIIAALASVGFIVLFTDVSTKVLLVLFAIAVIFAYVGALAIARADKNNARAAMLSLLACYFLFYLFFLWTLTVGTMRDSLDFILDDPARIGERLSDNTNFIPFMTVAETIKRYNANDVDALKFAVINIAGNIFALMPLAIFFPAFFKRQRIFPVFVVSVLLVDIFIEFFQFSFGIGILDIDDFIFNLSGAILFYLFLRIRPVTRLFSSVFPGIDISPVSGRRFVESDKEQADMQA